VNASTITSLRTAPTAPTRDGRGSAAAPVPPDQIYARIAGLLYLVVIVGGIFAEFVVREGAIVAGDPAQTASNILGSEGLFRVGFAIDLVVVSCDVALALLFFVLLRPVSESLALLAAFFRLTQAAMLAVIAVMHFAALVILSDLGYLDTVETGELDSVALALLDVRSYGYDVALVFFGISLLLVGYLVYRSGYLPRVLGVLLVIGGAGYLVDSFTSFLVPSLDEEIAVVLVPAVVAEVSLALWLLVRGVRGGVHERAPSESSS
jgi:hypothetical protein